MDNIYKRRQGIDWDNNLYLKLLRYVHENNLLVDENTYNNISNEQLKNLSIAVFPKYGQRKEHQEKVRFFLECFFASVIEDLTNFNIEFINAPSLKKWLIYKEKLSKAICAIDIRNDIKNFLTDTNYKIPLDTRKKILIEMYSIKECKDIQPWMMKSLNNTLWFNRNEICDEVNKLIFNHLSTGEDDSLVEPFHGFADKETPSDFNINILNSIISQICNDVSDNAYSSLTPETNGIDEFLNIKETKKTAGSSMKAKISCKNKIKKHRKSMNDKISGPVIEFFRQKDTNDNQLQLFKKLVILNIKTSNNVAFNKYMIGTGKINHETKTIILESIYGDDVKECHYSLLDLLKCQRYLIRRKTNEINNLLKTKNVKIHEELKNDTFFSDVEKKFYEVIEKVDV